jgi:hypothetical protein
MAIRTVRLDDEAEATLQQIRDASRQRPYDLYERLDLGPGGYARAPSTETRRGVATALCKKLRK